jgi:hypothetical protein
VSDERDDVKVGDTFRLKGPCFPRTVYEACDPGETYPGMVPVMMLPGFGWVPISDLVNEVNFERVRAVEVPPVTECRPMTDEKEQLYQAEIDRLRGEVEALARSGVENAKRYAADIDYMRSIYADACNVIAAFGSTVGK